MFFVLFLVICLSTITHQCSLSRTIIEHQLKNVHIPGLAAIVINSTNILYEEGFGYHSPISNERRIDPSKSIFVIASLSKTFIALAAMQLVEKGQLNLDVDINQYLNFPMKIFHPLYPNSTITMRHILSHSTGLGSNYDEEFQHAMPGDHFLKTNLTDVILRYLLNRISWLPEAPGNITYYTNIGPSWAALIIERISNISFEQYVRDNILNRLNISDTEASYRLSSFSTKQTDLVEHYIYNISSLDTFNKIAPQLNVSQVD